MQFKQGSRAAGLAVGAFLALGSSVATAGAAPYAMVTFKLVGSGAGTTASVPVMSDWVAIVMALLMAVGGAFALRRKGTRSLGVVLFASALILGGWAGDPLVKSARADAGAQTMPWDSAPGSIAFDGGTVFTAVLPPPLFEVREGAGGTIFLGDGSRAPSFISQVFGGSFADTGSAGLGFLGFGGADGGVFGGSTFSAVFNQTGYTMVIDDLQGFAADGTPFGMQGVFGAPTFERAPLTKVSPAPITMLCQVGARIPAGGSCSIGLVDRNAPT